ncbi:MAG: hypothetical protein P1P82_16755 [Bacteroidales bacterium]|nr:hypothetical protein [Bacteroidales bacterium]
MMQNFFPLQAQNTTSASPYSYSVAYFGNNLWNPGIKLGFEYDWKVQNETIDPATDNSTPHKMPVKKAWMPGGNIGIYLDPGSHAGLFGNAGISYRRTSEKGRNRHIALNPAGIYRSFLTETYAYDNQGGVDRVTLPGNLYYAPAFSFGVGKFTNRSLHSGWFTQVTVITLMPYNHWIMPLINLEVGFMFGKRGGAR